MTIEDGIGISEVIHSCSGYTSSFLVFLEDAPQSASDPPVLTGEAVLVGMLEVFKPASLDRCYPGDYGL